MIVEHVHIFIICISFPGLQPHLLNPLNALDSLAKDDQNAPRNMIIMIKPIAWSPTYGPGYLKIHLQLLIYQIHQNVTQASTTLYLFISFL